MNKYLVSFYVVFYVHRLHLHVMSNIALHCMSGKLLANKTTSKSVKYFITLSICRKISYSLQFTIIQIVHIDIPKISQI